MIRMSIKEMQGGFFDDTRVRAVLGKTRGPLGRAAAVVRGIAKQSMKYVSWKKGVPPESAPPGTPPHAIRRHPYLRKQLYFAMTPFGTVVVGPAYWPGKLGYAVPRILESGGSINRFNPLWRHRVTGNAKSGILRVGPAAGFPRQEKGRWRHTPYRRPTRTVWSPVLRMPVTIYMGHLKTAAQVARSARLNRELFGPPYGVVTIAPHPFMGPALTEAAGKIPSLWLNAITSTGAAPSWVSDAG